MDRYCAGWDAPRPFLQTDPALWKSIIDINLYGALNLHLAVCPHLKAEGGGSVGSLVSDAANAGAADVAVYLACKAGVIALSKSLARELASARILLNVVSPGPTQTPDAGRIRRIAPRRRPLAGERQALQPAATARNAVGLHRPGGHVARQRGQLHHRPDDLGLGRTDHDLTVAG